MKNRRISYAVIALVLAGLALAACLFIEQYAKTDLNSEIVFSHDSGFYDEPIEVELSVGDNYYITYTLDGRAPNAGCTKYEGPILITDATENENVWSVMPETSLRYFESDYYHLPDYKVDKCAVLRVAAFDYSGNQVSSDVREYFIGFDDKPGYKDIYNLCIVSDPENLFDVDTGIYNVGPYYSDKIQRGKIMSVYSDEYGWKREGIENWAVSGRKSERPATIEIFNPQGDLEYREACGIRIRGAFSRYDTQKPMGFYAREEYSGSDRFNIDLFGDSGISPKNFLIHSSRVDLDGKIKDYVIYSALSKGDFDFSITPIIPCNLFIDGEYWGPMYLMKDTNVNTIADDYELAAENIVLIKSGFAKTENDLLTVEEQEQNEWVKLQDFIRYNDMSLDENYEYVCSKIDIENLAEYSAIEMYIGNADWHTDNNTAFWRTLKHEKGNSYSDGKWRCSIFDVNWALQSKETIEEEAYDYLGWDMVYMLSALLKNEEFKKLYLDDIEKLEILFSSDTIKEIIDEWSDVMEEPIRCHYKRFGIKENPDDNMVEQKKYILDFFANRPEEINHVNEWLLQL